MAPIRILIAEGNPGISQALQRLLQQVAEIDIVGVASTGAEALHLAARLRPTVVLVDAALPPLDGRRVISRLKQRFPSLVIVALGVYPNLVDETLGAGACRFLLLDAPPSELLLSIQLAVQEDCQTVDNPLMERFDG